MSAYNCPVSRLTKHHSVASSPLSPFTFRWPEEQVSEVVQKAQFLELVRHSGWLLKQHGNGPHPRWSRKWFYLLDDRLCFTAEPGKVDDVRYIPLDRIPVRALPRGYGPQIGVTVVEDRQVNKQDLGQSGRRACVFSVQCGTHTHIMAAETAADAQLWVDRITQTWVHCSKYTGRSIRARNLEDSFVHTQQHLLHENAVLRMSLDELSKQQPRSAEEPQKQSRPQTLVHCVSAATNTLPADPQPAAPLQPPPLHAQQTIASQTSGFPAAPVSQPCQVAQPQQHWSSLEVQKEWSGPVTELVTYELELDTGQQQGAGSSAHVVLELFGVQKGQPCRTSGEHCLDQGPHQPVPFAIGQTDAFEIRCAELGNLMMVRISHDNSGTAPSWFLEEVRARLKGTNQWVHFYCGQWLAKEEADGAISRDLYKTERPKAVQYDVAITTSDLRGASTSADVYITLHGEQQSGYKHELAGGADVFNRGETSNFTIHEHELGDLTHMTIGHNSTGSSPSWHLELVVVTHLASQQQWLFSCGRWFDLQQEDGLTERDLYPGSEQQQPIWYNLVTYTSDLPGAGTDADISATIHGHKGPSPCVRLPTKGKELSRGSRDSFRMQLQSVGEVTMLTLGHENKGHSPDWHLDQAELTDESTGRIYYFACQRWFSLTKDDGLIERDLLPSQEDPHGQQTSYLAEVHTSDKHGAGTDADVSVLLFGDLGDSGVQPLNGDEAFARSAVDVFRFSSKAVGEMNMLRVSHDNIGHSPDWHLEKIAMTDEADGSTAVFRCNEWLSAHKGDRSTSRDLYLSDEVSEHMSDAESEPLQETTAEPNTKAPQQPQAEYSVSVHTSSCKGAGTEGGVSVELHGQQASSGMQQLQPQAPNSFARGQEASFTLRLAPLGDLQRLTLMHEGAEWHCEIIIIREVLSGDVWYFLCDRWLGQKAGTTVELQACQEDPRAPFHDYQITVITSDIQNAGTDGDVTLDIQGATSSSGPQHLHAASQQTFCRGMSDGFELRLRHLGPLQQATVLLEGSAASWHLHMVIIDDRSTEERWFFLCNDWLSKETGWSRVLPAQLNDPRLGHSLVDYQVVTYTSDLRGAGSDATIFAQLTGAGGFSPRCNLVPADRSASSFNRGQQDVFQLHLPELGPLQALTIGHDDKGEHPSWHLDLVEVRHMPTETVYYFPCRRWFDSSQDDNLTVRTLQACDSDPRLAVQAEDGLTEYEVTTHTSDVQDASTDADVFLVLYSATGESKPLQLNAPQTAFARNTSDTLQVKGPWLGPLTQTRVGHNARGSKPDWMLDWVRIKHLPSGQQWVFFAHRWLHSGNNNELVLKPGLLTQYSMKVYTTDVPQCMTNASGFAILHSLEESSQKILLPRQDRMSFQSGTEDVWSSAEMQDVGELQSMTLGLHEPAPDTAWHVTLVEVTCTVSSTTWSFPCQRWLGLQHPGGIVERELYPSTSPRRLHSPLRDYRVSIEALPGAAELTCQPCLRLQMHGPEGVTRPQPFQATQRGLTEAFDCSAEVVGPLTHLTVWLEPLQEGQGPWLLQGIEVLDKASDAVFYFPCLQWLDTAGKAKTKLALGSRPPCPASDPQPLAKAASEVPVEEEEWQAAVCQENDANAAKTNDTGLGGCYTVNIFGGSLPDGLWVDLEGLAGSSGAQALGAPTTEATFTIQTASHLGPLTQLTVSHEQSGQGWLLERIEVTDDGTGLLYIFFCGELLDASTSNVLQVAGANPSATSTAAPPPPVVPAPSLHPQISVTLAQSPSIPIHAAAPEPAVSDNTAQYTVTITTSDMPGAGTDCTAYIEVFGDQGNTGKQMLETEEGRFVRGSVHSCEVAGLNVGRMSHICIGHNDDGIESAWHLERVQVLNSSTGELVTFKCRAWLDATSEDGLIERDFYPMTECTYKLELQTSDRRGAGTTANGVISLIGSLAEAGPVQLVNHGNSFQQGQLDELMLEDLPDVGPIQQVEVGHDGEGSHAAWHLAWVRVTNLDTGETATFQCNRWLKQMGMVEEAPIINYMQSATADPVEQMQTLQQPQYGQVQIAQSQDLDEGSEGGHPPPQAGGYRLTFNTSPRCFSGINSQVYFELVGSECSTGVMVPAATKKSFRPGGCDIFTYPQMPYVGDPFRMRVFTDGAGLFSGWHLRDVDVLHLATNIRYVFGCHNWIDKRCKNQRILDLEFVQPPPMQREDWRVTQVLPEYSRAVSPFRPRYDAKSPQATSASARSRQTPRRSPQRLAFQQDQVASDGQSQSSSRMQPQTNTQPETHAAGTDGRLDVHQKLQRDFEHYRRIGQQKSVNSPGRQQSSIAAQPIRDSDKGIDVLGKRLQAAHSIARRGRLQHQSTVDVVPRFDSTQSWRPAKHPVTAADSMQQSEQMQQAYALPANTADRRQHVQIKQPLAQPMAPSTADQEQYVEDNQPILASQTGNSGGRQLAQDTVQQPHTEPRQRRRLATRTQSVVASAPPMAVARRSGSPTRRSPYASRFAPRGDRPVTPPGLAESQPIAAWRA